MQLIDLTGKKFGNLTVISRAKNKGKLVAWNCICDCGNSVVVTGNNLKNGHTKSCGCLKKITAKQIGKQNKIDLTGKKFGYLTVLKDSGERGNKHSVLWECRCECGNITKVAAGDLIKGSTRSCGCKKKELRRETRAKQMIGQRFGKLIVLAQVDEQDTDLSYKYLCQCDCGNTKIVSGTSLKEGSVLSCGCIASSIGEQNIQTILETNGIFYEKEKTFPTCLFPDTKKPARYDFFINNNRLIEFDGRQHYIGWDSQDSLIKIQTRDRYKNQWALKNNIPLVRIPYWERDNITLDMLLGDKYLVKGGA